MNRHKETFIETFILLSLPVALFAGCANSNLTHPVRQTVDSGIVTESKQIVALDNIQALHLLNKQVSYPLPNIDQGNATTPIDLGHSESGLERQLPETQPDQASETPLSEAVTGDSLASTTIPNQHVYYFASNECDIQPQDYVKLKQHADYLLQHPNLLLNIEGFSDQKGAAAYNQLLSNKRAKAIARLLRQFGVPENQILVSGHGEVTTASNDTRLDRRVELMYTNPLQVSHR